MARHSNRFRQGAGSRRRFSSTPSGRPKDAARLEAVSSALVCSESRPIKAGRYGDVVDLLVKHGFRLKMLREEEIDLEDVFMAITKGITQ